MTWAKAWPMALTKSAGVRASSGAQQGFDLAPHLFNRIEVRGVCRQEEHLGTGLGDQSQGGVTFVG